MSLPEVVQPLFWISKPLGVLPLTFRNEKFLISSLSLLYTICGTVCFAIGGFSKSFKQLSRLFVYPLDGKDILSLVSHNVVNVFAFMNIYFARVCAKKLSHMFNELNTLMKTTKNVSYWNTAMQVKFLVIILQIIVFINYMMHTIYGMSQRGIDYTELFFATMRILSLTSITCISTHFCAMCLILRSLIKAMNSELEQMFSSCFEGSSQIKVESLTEKLLQQRYLYAKIFDICTDMNNIFGIFILLSLTQYNIYIHVEVFEIVTLLVDFNIRPVNNWTSGHTKALIWALINVMKIVSHFISCSLVISETKKTGMISSKYLAKMPHGVALESIDCFSRAVAAMKLAFSANGFFSIDWEILFSSASACTVNTLILIQSYVNNYPDSSIITETE